jgi:RimJ/RimL family protein N-acetyltransferase
VRPVRLDSNHEFRIDNLHDSDAILGDDRVTRWLSFGSRTREQQAEVLTGAIERAQQTPRTEYYLAVTTHTDGRLIGFVRLGLGGVQAAKLGGAGVVSRWGNGYALDDTRTIVDFEFTTLGLHRISAAIGPDNAHPSPSSPGSISPRKAGYAITYSLNGAWRDFILYSLLTVEWKAPTTTPE